MSKIRVLLIDDSVVIRRLLAVYLASDSSIEVVGTAADGKIGLAKIAQLSPDLVILDIEMPVMDGLQTLAELRKIYKTLPVIMFSTLTERGASATLDALSLGASDYATKSTEGGTARQHICADLIPKVKALCSRKLAGTTTALPLRTQPGATLPSRSMAQGPIEVVTIGVSTGGPNALAALVTGLTPHFPVPIVIVQHMPQMFTRLLAERLAFLSGAPVREGKAGELLRPGEMWLAPGGFHMDLERVNEGVRIRIHEGPHENSCRPAVDVLFRSVAQVYGPRTLAVVLTGMGQDGLRGCENIRERGGRILVQDEATSVVWGMPGAVYQAGLADKILPLHDLAAEINRVVGLGGARPAAPFKPASPTLQPSAIGAL